MGIIIGIILSVIAVIFISTAGVFRGAENIVIGLVFASCAMISPSMGTTFNASFVFWAGLFSVLFHISQVQLSFVLWSIVLVMGIYFASTANKKAHGDIIV